MKLFEVCVAKTYYYYTKIHAESVEDAEEKVLVSDMNLEGPDYFLDNDECQIWNVEEIKQ
jgi:hypothetical protein